MSIDSLGKYIRELVFKNFNFENYNSDLFEASIIFYSSFFNCENIFFTESMKF